MYREITVEEAIQLSLKGKEVRAAGNLNEELLRKLYIDCRWSAKKIGDKCNINVSKVFRMLKQYGIARKAGPDDPIDRSCLMETEAR